MRCIEGLLFIFLSNVHYMVKEIDPRTQKEFCCLYSFLESLNQLKEVKGNRP